jgi:hypothetical protein
MSTASLALHRVSVISTLIFGLALTTTWAALLGYGLFRLGELAIAYWPSALIG